MGNTNKNVNELHNELKELQAEMVLNAPTWSYQQMEKKLEAARQIRKLIEWKLNQEKK